MSLTISYNVVVVHCLRKPNELLSLFITVYERAFPGPLHFPAEENTQQYGVQYTLNTIQCRVFSTLSTQYIVQNTEQRQVSILCIGAPASHWPLADTTGD